MEIHPTYIEVKKYCEMYPVFKGPLFAVYLDLKEVQKWKNISIEAIPNLDRCGIKRKKFGSSTESKIKEEVIIPCFLEEKWGLETFRKIFECFQVDVVTLGILSSDSTIVYYKVHKGIIKPRDVDSDDEEEEEEEEINDVSIQEVED